MSFTDLYAANLSSIDKNNQRETNFCHSFATTVGLRKALAIVMKGKKSRTIHFGPQKICEVNDIAQYVPVVVEGGMSIDEVLSDERMESEIDWNRKWREIPQYEFCSTKSFLSNLIGSVNPRSFAGLDGDYAKSSALNNQKAHLDKLLGRLTSPTLFEVAGWKRILAVVKLFEAFSSEDEILNPEHYELVARKVSHPNSIGIETFQEEIIKAKALDENHKEKVQTKMEKSWFKAEATNFIVSFNSIQLSHSHSTHFFTKRIYVEFFA